MPSYLYCATFYSIHGSIIRLLDRLAAHDHHERNTHISMVIKPFALSLSKGSTALLCGIITVLHSTDSRKFFFLYHAEHSSDYRQCLNENPVFFG